MSTKRPKGGSSWWISDEISYSQLLDYLSFQKHFYEDWCCTLYRLYYFLFDRHSLNSNESIVKRLHKQRRKIKDLIDKALEREYLLKRDTSINPTSSEIYLKSGYKGRDFLKPLNFFESCLREYNGLVTFFLGVGVGWIIFMLDFWNRTINYISNLF